MAWFRRGAAPDAAATDDVAGAEDATDAGDTRGVTTDTVGNPIVQRSLRASGARHAAPDAGPTRAEHRMLQAVAEGRVAWMAAGAAATGFWRIDGAFANGPKAMMLDWLQEEGYLELGPRVRVAATAVLTDPGRAVLAGEA